MYIRTYVLLIINSFSTTYIRNYADDNNSDGLSGGHIAGVSIGGVSLMGLIVTIVAVICVK